MGAPKGAHCRKQHDRPAQAGFFTPAQAGFFTSAKRRGGNSQILGLVRLEGWSARKALRRD